MARKGKPGRGKKPTDETVHGSDKAAERRVAHLRDKLTTAMQDPLMREQIVRAIRAMMNQPK